MGRVSDGAKVLPLLFNLLEIGSGVDVMSSPLISDSVFCIF